MKKLLIKIEVAGIVVVSIKTCFNEWYMCLHQFILLKFSQWCCVCYNSVLKRKRKFNNQLSSIAVMQLFLCMCNFNQLRIQYTPPIYSIFNPKLIYLYLILNCLHYLCLSFAFFYWIYLLFPIVVLSFAMLQYFRFFQNRHART